MAKTQGEAVQIEPMLTPEVRHPIRAARLLYSAPPAVLRGPIYLIFIIMFSALLYSFWAKKDILVVAPLVLERESYTIEAVGGGMVSNIVAKEDAFANSGDPLLSVQEQIRVSMTPEQEAMESQKFELLRELDKIEDEYTHQLAQLELDLVDVTTGGETGKRAMEGRIAQIEEQLATADRARRRQGERLALANKQFQRRKELFDQRDITINEYEQALEAVNDAAKGLDDAKARIEEIRIQLQTSRDELTQLSDSKRKEKLEQELAQLQQRKERDIKRLNEQIAGIEDKLNRNPVSDTVEFKENQALYKSDFDGLITQIHVRTGEIITPGTSLVTLIKDTSVLEGHTFVENQDIGNLSRGQQVRIKYFAYPYQEYGIAKGVISSIATTPSGLPGKENKYLVRVVLGTRSISRRGARPKTLEIGLEGIAEIKTGEKRFIELLFSPISTFFAQPEETA